MKTDLSVLKIFLIPITAFCMLLTSCDKQDDRFAEGDFMVFFGMVEKNAALADSSCRIRLDNGDKFESSLTHPGLKELKAGQRVLVNFTPSGEKSNLDRSKTFVGKINYIQNILYKDILRLPKVNAESLGHDPIIFRDAWISGDNMLTIKFNFYTSGGDHSGNLIYMDEGNGIDQPYVFEFRHNANKDQRMWLTADYISFNLAPYLNMKENKIAFLIRYIDYDGRKIDSPHTLSY